MSDKSRRRDLAGRVRTMRKALRELIAAQGRQSKKVEDLEFELAALQRDLSATPIGPTVRTARREGIYEELQRRQARAGVAMLEIHLEGDGALVRLNGGPWFGLPGQLARLLSIISDDTRLEKDGFPAWRTHAEIAERLNVMSGEATLEPDSVPHLVHRLRKALREQDANPFWVETAQAKGVRFRHRKRGGLDLDPVPAAV